MKTKLSPLNEDRILLYFGVAGAFLESFALFFRGAAKYHLEIPLFIILILGIEKFFENKLCSKFSFNKSKQKINIEKSVNFILRYFAPSTLLLATLTSYIYFAYTDTPPERALNIFTAILLCASPCSLRMAIPSALAAGEEAMAKRKVGGSDFLEMTSNQARTNVFFAGVYNFAVIIGAVVGYLTPIKAVALSGASTIFILLSSLSLKFRIKNFGL